MKYLCLIYEDEKAWQGMSKADMEKGLGEYRAFGDSIRQSGQYVGGNALQPTNTATSVRVRNGKISTSDGPYVETKEHLGGFTVVDVADEEAARVWAGKIATACGWPQEVRRFREPGGTTPVTG